jgi:CDP-diacylglycerol--glycerol-3-phosphate 3-phosphatidyltransferase
MILNLPTLITLSRIIALMPLSVAFAYHAYGLCLILMIWSGLSDGLDGYLARRLNQTSVWGKVFDPIADKIFVAGVFLLLCPHSHYGSWLSYCGLITITRDFILCGLRQDGWAGARQTSTVSWLAKSKTAILMAGLSCITLGVWQYSLTIEQTGLCIVVLSTLLSAYSAYKYITKT